MDLGGFAAAIRALANEAEAGLALDCIHPMAKEALVALKLATPMRSGKLRGSETIDTIGGSGAFAYAIISPHTVYAEFRDKGGTITRHGPGSLGNPSVGFFGHQVTQKGSHYMARGEAAGRGPCHQAAARVCAAFFTL